MLAKPRSATGYTASPLLAGGKLVVNIGGECFGLDPATGKTDWRVKQAERFGSPVRATVADVEYVVLPKGDVLRADTGKLAATGAAANVYQTAVVHDGVVYSMRDDPFSDEDGSAKMLAVRLTAGKGDALSVTKLWDVNKGSNYSSPLVHDGVLYTSKNKTGVMSFDAKSGKPLGLERVKTNNGENYPCLAFAGGKLFVPFDDGKIGVVTPGEEMEVERTNDLFDRGDQLVGGPAFSGNRIYLRTHKAVYCIGTK
jgi:hypothetical protein